MKMSNVYIFSSCKVQILITKKASRHSLIETNPVSFQTALYVQHFLTVTNSNLRNDKINILKCKKSAGHDRLTTETVCQLMNQIVDPSVFISLKEHDNLF